MPVKQKPCVRVCVLLGGEQSSVSCARDAKEGGFIHIPEQSHCLLAWDIQLRPLRSGGVHLRPVAGGTVLFPLLCRARHQYEVKLVFLTSRVHTDRGRSWKVVKIQIFQAWKVMELGLGPRKSWKVMKNKPNGCRISDPCYVLRNFGLHIFHFWSPHFSISTPQFGWTRRLNYTTYTS